MVTATDGTLVADDVAATGNEIPTGTLQYATVVKADPITSSEKLYATVIGTEAVRETTSTSTPVRSARTWSCRSDCPSAMATWAAPWRVP